MTGSQIVRGLRGFGVTTALAGLVFTAGAIAAPTAQAADDGLGESAWWYEVMRIGKAHQETTGKGVTIALIDTPVAPDVPELAGQDVVPVTNVCGGKATGTGPIADHGTRMATYIVGSGKGNGPGGAGVLGIAPDATLRTYGDDASPAEGQQCNVDLGAANAAAIDAAVKGGARIINYSAGGVLESPQETAAVKRALAAGVIVVGAAGRSPDDPSVVYPAAIPGVVAVAAVDREAEPWENNVNGGREAFVISAPGVDLPAAGFRGEQWVSTGTVSGTSGAAALVSGGLALVMAAYPDATGNQIIQHLIHNVGGEEPFGRNDVIGYGVISVTEMLANDPATWPDVNPLTSAAAPQAPGPGAAGGSGSDAALAASDTGDDAGGGVPAILWVLAAAAVVLVIGGLVGGFVLMGRSRGNAPAASVGGPGS